MSQLTETKAQAVELLREAARIIDLNSHLFRQYMPASYELDWGRALAGDIKRFADVAKLYPGTFTLTEPDE